MIKPISVFIFVLVLLSVHQNTLAAKKKDKKSEDAQLPVVIERTKLMSHSQRAQEQDQALAEQLTAHANAGEVTWLSSTSEEDFLSLYLSAKTPNLKGVLVFIGDAAEHANWPGLFRQARMQLPNDGWATLSISVPATTQVPDPIFSQRSSPTVVEIEKGADQKKKRDEKSDAPTPAEQKPAEPVATQAELDESWGETTLARMQAAVTHARANHSGKLIVVAKGKTATLLTNKTEGDPIQMDATILLDLKVQMRTEKKTQNPPNMPILDIITGSRPHPKMRHEQSKARALAAKLANQSHYRILYNPSSHNGNFDKRWYLSRIRGWLRSTFD